METPRLSTHEYTDPNFGDSMQRYRAIELAIRCSEQAENPETTVDRAKAFSDFIING